MFDIFKTLKIDRKEAQIRLAKDELWDLRKKVAFLKICKKMKSKKAADELEIYSKAVDEKKSQIRDMEKELIDLKYNVNITDKQ